MIQSFKENGIVRNVTYEQFNHIFYRNLDEDDFWNSQNDNIVILITKPTLKAFFTMEIKVI